MRLAPCPFCGAPGDALLLLEVDAGTHAVTCPNCNCIGPHDSDPIMSAGYRWNARSDAGLAAAPNTCAANPSAGWPVPIGRSTRTGLKP